MKIILVDDDAGFSRLIQSALEEIPGLTVRSASSAGAGLLAATEIGGVDLLITDVVMEPMNGFLLRDQVKERYPQARVLFLSGFDLSDYAEQVAGHQFLQKPFEMSTLVEAVQKELAQVAPRAVVQIAPPAVVQVVPQPSPTPAVNAHPSPDGQPMLARSTKLRGGGTMAARVALPAAAQPASQSAAARTPTAVLAATDRIPAPEQTAPKTTHPIQARQARVSLPAAVQAVRTAPPAAQAKPAAEEPFKPRSNDPLIGSELGAYKINSQMGEGRWGPVYSAIQVSINRHVALKVLDLHRAVDPVQKDQFIADARAKAKVQHPAILSVYEAGEVGEYCFYAHEFVPGDSLAMVQSRGQQIDEKTALRILRTASEGLNYLHLHKIGHPVLDAAHIYLGPGFQPRLSNSATQDGTEGVNIEQDIQALGRIVLSLLPVAQNLSVGLRALLSRMLQNGPGAIASWGALLQAIKALEPKVIPLEAAKITAQDRAAIEAVEAARREQRRSLWITTAGMTASLTVVCWVVWHYAFRSNERSLEAQIEIPAGEYVVGRNNRTVKLERFWIDKYEVTVGQYAKFLEYLDAHPTADFDFNHEKQPRHLSHKPDNWEIYYLNAVAGKSAHSVPMSLNSPVMTVTWWDAYAYAKWKGRELPTEEEWEAAARGPQGLAYPWGNELERSKVNSNSDFNAQNPGAKGQIDGFSWWGDVDLMRGDRSSFGVIGMAGNVSEWVDWPKGTRFPVYKGGNFQSADTRLDRRVADQNPNKGEESIGFRTISRTPPK
jgi:formylglycine-generating enzyme required for sulfatase activity/DNA-binding NarL/FixJ family response regulator